MKILRVFRAFSNVQELVDRRDVKGLVELLQWRWNSLVREEGARALGKISDERAVGPLIKGLQDESEKVRSSAARSLGEIGDKRALEPLIEALADKEWMVKSAASYALGKIGDERAVEPLIAVLKDESEETRRSAASALAVLGDQRAVEPLIEALQDTLLVKERAAEALGWLGDARAVEPLLKVIASWPSWSSWQVVGVALGRIGDEQGMKALRAYLKDPGQKLRVTAADSLLQVGELKPGGDVKGYFVSEPPEGDGLCSDNECPCPGMGADIPRGEGYLYISRSVVANRQHHRTESDAQSLISRRNDQIRGELPGFTGRVVGQQGRFAPILCCREGAERRELDLQVAAKDAAFWWETGLVPLRATPRV